MQDTDFVDRFRRIVKEFGGTQKNLADLLGFSQGNIGDFARGDKRLTASIIYALSNLGVSIDWLLLGKGELKVQDSKVYSEYDLKSIQEQFKECEKVRQEQRKTIDNLNLTIQLLKDVVKSDSAWLEKLDNASKSS